MSKDYLVEIGVEEMPARMIAGALESFERVLVAAAAEEELAPGGSQGWATPRRLAVKLSGLAPRQQDRVETVVGPPADKAFDDSGAPTRAAEGFAKGRGVPVESLQVVETPRGRAVAATVERPGREAAEVLADVVPRVVLSLSFPKTMRWGSGSIRFVRAIRNLVSLLDDQVVPFEIAGVQAGRVSFGHRYAGKREIPLGRVSDYELALEAEHVMLDPGRRRQAIQEAMASLASEVSGRVLDDPELLAEVVHLVEEPHVVRGRFEEAYLSLPREVLVTAMRHHQKSFSVLGEEGRPGVWFLNVANMPDTEGAVARGYERVLNARLADARFFWDEDRKRSLASLASRLGGVVYLDELGSYADKARQLESLVARLGETLELEARAAEHLREAAGLAKCDLATDLVGEFAELQGVAGGLLLAAEGAPEAVARAVGEHYRPESLERPSPGERTGALLGAADKLDAVVGPFLIGHTPTGTRDPFGLRRAAHGLVKTLLDHELPLDLAALVDGAAQGYAEHPGLERRDDRLAAVRDYLVERTSYVFQSQGVAPDVADAVLAVRPLETLDAFQRARALARLRAEPALGLLVTIHKRIRNILAQADAGRYEESGLVEPAERNLARAFEEREQGLGEALASREHETALRGLAELAEPLQRFFEDVMVMAEDETLRRNRTGLLAVIRASLERFADFGRLVPPAS